MKKGFTFLLISIMFLGINNVTVNAKSQEAIPSFEEQAREAGFKTAVEAVKEFEKHCNCEIILPKKIPSIPFTHEFAKTYIDKEYGINDLLEIRFLNSEERDHLFKIDIRLDKIDFKKIYEGREYPLDNGDKGFYFESSLFNFFVFEKGDLQYLLGIRNTVKNIDHQKELLEIANSVK
ncbi:carbon monoxide dehydrogenase [Lysinibacillus sp. SGAir0095]|uniref:carbon monoxide dehydrogenase n=1 Tax=Lysinibacillus sp. SGAir0095 TaxID=2070463 RepID=UPI001F0FE8DB|nr:carbon monoxide dehydrogenase [Lysinibacillus sp. SGAir0095]